MTAASERRVRRDPAVADIGAQARAWVRLLATGRPTTEDAQAFRQWREQSPAHAQAWTQASREWKEVGEVAEAFRMRHPHAAARTAPARPERRWFLGAAASAAGALGVAAMVRPPMGLWPSWSELGADYRTATGEQRDISLDGQVRLALNTQTSVAVHAGGELARIELIAGEAAVQNPRPQPLEILAGEGRIRLAVGGVEVRRMAGDRVRVLCTDGAAELRHPLRTVALQAREEIAYDAATVGQPSHRAVAGIGSAWRRGMVAFDDTPLAAAVEEINRYRPGRVVLVGEQLAQQRISGRFRIGALDQAIVQIQQLYGAEVRRLGDVVLLS